MLHDASIVESDRDGQLVEIWEAAAMIIAKCPHQGKKGQ